MTAVFVIVPVAALRLRNNTVHVSGSEDMSVAVLMVKACALMMHHSIWRIAIEPIACRGGGGAAQIYASQRLHHVHLCSPMATHPENV